MKKALIAAFGTLLFTLPAMAQQPQVIDTVGSFDTTLKAHETSSRPPTWVPEVNVILQFADWSSDDILIYQLKKGRKKIGKAHKCTASANVKEAKANAFAKVKKNVDLVFFGCKPDDKHGLAKGGRYSLELSYKQTLQGKTFKNIATLQMEVITALHGNHTKPYKHFIENNDIRMGTTVMYEELSYDYDQSKAFHMLENAAQRETGLLRQACQAPGMRIRTWFKQGEERLPSTKMSCLYKGKKVAESSDFGGWRRKYWTYKRKGKNERVVAEWVQKRYDLKKLKFDPPCGWEEFKKENRKMDQFWLSKNPGEYRCVITGEGDIFKEIYFTVGADGKIVKDACNEQINTMRYVTILPTVEKKVANVKYDKKLAKKYGFNRVVWKKGCPPKK